jgi:hypothetical protein
MMKTNYIVTLGYASMTFLLLALVGCGGGGGGGGAATPQTLTVTPVASTFSFPIDATVTTFFTTSSTANMSSPSDSAGNTFARIESIAPQPDALYNNVLTKNNSLNIAAKMNGVTYYSYSGLQYFSTAPFRFLGSTENSVQTITILPATATVGTIGGMYTGHSGGSFCGVTSCYYYLGTWSLEADTSTTAFLCINKDTTFWNGSNFDASRKVTELHCYRIDQSGTIIGRRLDIFFGDGTIEHWR